jgi:hypothetical protein
MTGAGVEQTILTCDLWCDPDDVAQAVDGLSIDDAFEAVAESSWALNALLDDRYHAPCCYVERHRLVPGGCEIKLGHGPVVVVKSVMVVDPCDEAVNREPEGWCLKGGRVISTGDASRTTHFPRGTFGVGFGDDWFTRSGCAPCGFDHTQLEVVFSVASTLPPGARRVAKKYAIELARSGLGLPCELPARKSTVTRQGVSWTIFDPSSHIESGLTGVDSVDTWVATARRGLGGEVFDPLHGSMISCTKYCCDISDPDDPPTAEAES